MEEKVKLTLVMTIETDYEIKVEQLRETLDSIMGDRALKDLDDDEVVATLMHVVAHSTPTEAPKIGQWWVEVPEDDGK